MYSIKNDNEVYIYDSIEQGITARALLKALDADSESITLRINSSGGDVFEAIAIYNWLKGHECHVNVYIDGLCASAASVIAMAGDNIYMPS
ncbi:MAG: Clp protease ClpP, partial [Synergistaceae bacterium]|nr:Clp protease ClpP [Synergistaceae bacterium]